MIPDAPIESDIRFEDRAVEAGLDFHMTFLATEQGADFKINLYDHGCGAVLGDVNGDGWDDVLLLNQLGPNALFFNQGDGTFVDATARAGIALEDRICVAGAFADIDSDGDQDLYITSSRGGNVLFANHGDGTFEDVTEAAGVEHIGHSQGATFFDYDNDGNLDLFVTNTAEWTTDSFAEAGNYYYGKAELFDLVDSKGEPNILYRNRGDGTFEDVTDDVGLGGTAWGGDFAAFDYDEDGDLDLLVSNMFGASMLYRNDDGEAFVDVREQVLGRTSWGTIGIRLLDVDTDGRLDIAFADMHSDMWTPLDIHPRLVEPGRKYRGPMGRLPELHPASVEDERDFVRRVGVDLDASLFGNSLFRNKGDGTFEEISEQAGFETFWPWGVATGDFDCDGHEDVYLPSGMGYPFIFWQSALLQNQGDGTFVDVAEPTGIALPRGQRYLPDRINGTQASRSSRCAATSDLDGDGRLDIVSNNFNDVPFLYMNGSPKRNYVAFQLRGTKSNRDAIGAVVRVTTGGVTRVRQVQGAGGYLSQSSLRLHFGLGDATMIDRVEVRWPSGLVTDLTDVPMNRVHEIVEEATDAPPR